MKLWMVVLALLIGAYAVDYRWYDGLYFNTLTRMAKEIAVYFRR